MKVRSCEACGFNPKAKNRKPRTKQQRIAKAIFRAANRANTNCCGKSEENCICWRGYMQEAAAAMKVKK